MPCTWPRYLLGALLLTLLIGGPIAYSRHLKANYRNFRVVEDGKLYRSGQLSLPTLKRTIEEYGIRTVISLRYADREGERAPDWKEEEFCIAHGIRYVRIRPLEWVPDATGKAPAEKPVGELVKVMGDPATYPALIHCFAGMHRTGAFCAVYRIEFQGWHKDEALRELKELGYDNLEKEGDVRAFLLDYVPRRDRPKGR